MTFNLTRESAVATNVAMVGLHRREWRRVAASGGTYGAISL